MVITLFLKDLLSGYYAQINAATRSIDAELYELQDPHIEKDLVNAAHRGVRVRVLLNRADTGTEENSATYTFLKANGVAVKWDPKGYIFHAKITTFDGRTSDVSTANFTPKWYSTTRDAQVIDTNPSQVRAIEATFDNDYAAAPGGKPKRQTVQGGGLIWSPNTTAGTAQDAFVAQIDSARHSVWMESEELSDSYVYQALARKAKAGVQCRVVMTNQSDWHVAFSALAKAGCAVRTYPDTESALYIHEKLLLVDNDTRDQSLIIGSQNASDESLSRDRELSLRLSTGYGGAAVIASVASTFLADFEHATAWDSTGSPTSSGSTTTTSAPVASAPPTTHSPSSGTTPTGSACHPKTSSGRCYTAGELCPAADHGLTGIASNGETIDCADDNGWRWRDA